MKLRLITGTINNWRDDGEWMNVTLDICERPIYDEASNSFLAPDVVADMSAGLPMFRDGMFDEVRAHHVLEHMPLPKVEKSIEAAHRVLKRGGIFDVAVPDLDAVCRAWEQELIPREDLQKWIYGEELQHHQPGDSHRFGFWEVKLRELLVAAGFVVGERYEEGGLEMRLRVRRAKP